MSGARRIDLTGKRFASLVVLSFNGIAKSGDAIWNCQCDCGKLFIAKGTHIRKGDTSSCGCARIKHGGCDRPEYTIWEGMIQRCTNPNAKFYKYYGGRGIKVCDRWRDFQNFFNDMGERPGKEFSIERIDGDKDYEPSNCKWATKTEQQHNLKNFKRNSSGTVGIFHDKKSNSYRVSISVNNKTKSLGSFKNIKDAIEARRKGEAKYWGKTP